MQRRHTIYWVIGGAALLAVVVLWAAHEQRSDPARCPSGRVPQGARCCWFGQRSEDGRCVGQARQCSPPHVLVDGLCSLPAARVQIAGGSFTVSPNDWTATGSVAEEHIEVASFGIDRSEVTVSQWRECAAAGVCSDELPARQEAELPVTGISAAQAEAYCAWRGGRLPTRQQWLFAAAGGENRRYPWGQTGLVCRRAVFGLIRGPCGVGATGPDSVGARPDGASPSGLLDMAGNVAEWARGSTQTLAMGGSYLSQVASELKVWSSEVPRGRPDHVGFRCVYPPGAGPAGASAL